jgi:hypothetical protein
VVAVVVIGVCLPSLFSNVVLVFGWLFEVVCQWWLGVVWGGNTLWSELW